MENRICSWIENASYYVGIFIFVTGNRDTAACLIAFACYWRLHRTDLGRT